MGMSSGRNIIWKYYLSCLSVRVEHAEPLFYLNMLLMYYTYIEKKNIEVKYISLKSKKKLLTIS